MPLTLLVVVVVSFANFHVLTTSFLFWNATLPDFPTHFFLFSHKNTHAHANVLHLHNYRTTSIKTLFFSLLLCAVPHWTRTRNYGCRKAKRSTLVTDLNATGARDVRREAGPMSDFFLCYTFLSLCLCAFCVVFSREIRSLSLSIKYTKSRARVFLSRFFFCSSLNNFVFFAYVSFGVVSHTLAGKNQPAEVVVFGNRSRDRTARMKSVTSRDLRLITRSSNSN